MDVTTGRTRAEARREELNRCFLGFGPVPEQNVNRLVALLGEQLGADCAFYNRLEDGRLRSIGQWCPPTGLRSGDPSKGCICHDLVLGTDDGITVIRNLPDTPYGKSDPRVARHDLMIYVGKPVREGAGFIGAVCAFFQGDYVQNPEDDKLLNIIASAIGVEEHRWRVMAAQQRNEALLQAQFEHSPDTILILDREYRVVTINRVWPGGATANDLVGREALTLLPQSEREAARNALAACFAGGGIQEFRHQAGKEKWMRSRIVPMVTDGQVATVMVIATDITERLLLEQQFRQAQKMETLGRLAGGVAHDFNNCLQDIMGLAGLLLASGAEATPAAADLREIERAAHRAARITRQLLAFSRKQPMEMRVVDVNELVNEQQKMLQRLVGEDISIHLELTPALWRTKADGGQLEQVLMNLVVNARESMPQGGRIVITTTNVVFDGRDILIRSEMRTGRFICCSVTDTGAGMPPEVMAHLFEPFFTTKGNERGTGLGLAVVHGVVSQHEGWIHVYTTPGKGSEFKLYLPAVPFSEPALAAAPAAAGLPKGAGQRILHVEDDHDVRNVTCRNLHGYGYQVVGSGSVAEARDVFTREKGAFDLVFCDVVLPDGNGVDLVGELVGRQASLRVLVTSGYTDEKARWPEIQRRGWRFLPKPYPFTELLQALHEELSREKPATARRNSSGLD